MLHIGTDGRVHRGPARQTVEQPELDFTDVDELISSWMEEHYGEEAPANGR